MTDLVVVEKKQRKKPVFHTIENIRKLFEEREFMLVSTEYKTGVKLQYICNKGHDGNIIIGSFLAGAGCSKCSIEKIHNLNKTPFNIIKNEFILNNCILISQESDYKDRYSILEFTCSQNHVNKCTFIGFRDSINKCKKCKRIKAIYSNGKHLSIKDVQNLCDEKNFKLISTECNGHSHKLEYLCDKGHKNIGDFASIRKLNPCKECNGTLPITIEIIRKLAEERGITLLSTGYGGIKEKLKFCCPKGHECEMSYESWKKSCHGCLVCAKEKTNEKMKHSYDFIKGKFEEKNCILLTTNYDHSSQKLKYICSNNHEVESTFRSFTKLEKGCVVCSGKFTNETSEMAKEIILKEKLESVREMFKLEGHTLLANEYKDNVTKLEYKCSNGHIVTTTVTGFKAGKKCPICSDHFNNNNSESVIEIIKENRLEKLRESFKLDGYTLLSNKYNNCETKLKYKCPNNHIGFITSGAYNSGQKCTECNIRSYGEQNIKKYFDDNNINYVREYKSKDCKNKQELPFDFHVNNNFLIEFDGIQHFKNIEYFGGQKALEYVQMNDVIKTKYCFINNIPLLRISYKEIKEIAEIIKQFMEDIEDSDKTGPFIHFSNTGLYEHLIKVCK